MSDIPRSDVPSGDPDWDLLARYVAGEAAPDEIRHVEQLLAEHPERRELIDALADCGRNPDCAEPTSIEVHAALASVLSRREIPGVQHTTPVISLDAHRHARRATGWRIAAGLFVVLGAGALWRTRVNSDVQGAPVSYASAVGALDSVVLSDGTRVLLGPGSRLTVNADYGNTERSVSLVGEARFDVVHKSDKPFSVHTVSATFRDVGTVFTVHSDSGDGSHIVVMEGAVAVRSTSSGAEVTLGKGDRASVESKGEVKVDKASATNDDVAWTTGHLVFHDAPVAQVAADLKRWFGVDLRVDSALAQRRLTASFSRDSSADVGPVVSAALGGGFRQDGVVLQIVPAPTSSAPR